MSRRRVTFTDIWRSVGETFPNSLTPDALSIRELLRDYAKEASGGKWQILPRFNQRVKQHSLMIWHLARLGHALGYKIWIGRNEQRDLTPAKEPLGSLVTARIDAIVSKTEEEKRALSDMDLLWIKRNAIAAAFEIEVSTSITSAIERGAHLPPLAGRYIVLPGERIPKLKRKMKSSFFRQGMIDQDWKVLLFDTVTDSIKDLLTKKVKLTNLVWDYSSDPALRDSGQLKLI